MKHKIFFIASTLSLALMTQTTVAQYSISTDTQETKVSNSHDDLIITKSVKEHIKASKVLGDLPVDVATANGVVTITGNVDSDAQASQLIELANSIIGVKDVDASKLNIKKSTQPFADMVITAKIKGLFIKEKLFGEKDIAAINLSVETKNSEVYLTGDIDNNDQIKNAIEIIKKDVPEVKSIKYRVRKIIPQSQD